MWNIKLIDDYVSAKYNVNLNKSQLLSVLNVLDEVQKPMECMPILNSINPMIDRNLGEKSSG